MQFSKILWCCSKRSHTYPNLKGKKTDYLTIYKCAERRKKKVAFRFEAQSIIIMMMIIMIMIIMMIVFLLLSLEFSAPASANSSF